MGIWQDGDRGQVLNLYTLSQWSVSILHIKHCTKYDCHAITMWHSALALPFSIISQNVCSTVLHKHQNRVRGDDIYSCMI